MEILIRDSSGYVHRRFEHSASDFLNEDIEDFEEVDEADLTDISSEAWCKHCFEMVSTGDVVE